MTTTTDDIIDEIINREGGFTDHPYDRGGPTKYGITLQTLRAWRREPVTVDDVRNLTREEARRIYNVLYITRPGFHMINDYRLRSLIVDCAVHHGVARAAKWLQEAAGVAVDGIVGPVTLAAVNSTDPRELYKHILARRARLFGEIISKDHSQAVFARGWMNRLAEFIERC